METPPETGTRARILEAAEELFAEKGYAGTRLHEIAEKVGVQKASLFHHFAGKEALYRAVLEMGFIETEAIVRSALAQSGSPIERLQSIIDTYVDVIASHPARTKILLRQSLGDTPFGPWTEHAQRLLHSIADYVRAQSADGVFQEIDAEALVLGISGVMAFFFTTAPVLDPEGFGNPSSPRTVARIKAHLGDVLARCLVHPEPLPQRARAAR